MRAWMPMAQALRRGPVTLVDEPGPDPAGQQFGQHQPRPQGADDQHLAVRAAGISVHAAHSALATMPGHLEKYVVRYLFPGRAQAFLMNPRGQLGAGVEAQLHGRM